MTPAFIGFAMHSLFRSRSIRAIGDSGTRSVKGIARLSVLPGVDNYDDHYLTVAGVRAEIEKHVFDALSEGDWVTMEYYKKRQAKSIARPVSIVRHNS